MPPLERPGAHAPAQRGVGELDAQQDAGIDPVLDGELDDDGQPNHDGHGAPHCRQVERTISVVFVIRPEVEQAGVQAGRQRRPASLGSPRLGAACRPRSRAQLLPPPAGSGVCWRCRRSCRDPLTVLQVDKPLGRALLFQLILAPLSQQGGRLCSGRARWRGSSDAEPRRARELALGGGGGGHTSSVAAAGPGAPSAPGARTPGMPAAPTAPGAAPRSPDCAPAAAGLGRGGARRRRCYPYQRHPGGAWSAEQAPGARCLQENPPPPRTIRPALGASPWLLRPSLATNSSRWSQWPASF